MINFCPTSIYHKNSVSQFCSENFMFPFTVLKIKDMFPWRKSQAKQRLSIHWYFISRKKKYMVKMVASYLLEKQATLILSDILSLTSQKFGLLLDSSISFPPSMHFDSPLVNRGIFFFFWLCIDHWQFLPFLLPPFIWLFMCKRTGLYYPISPIGSATYCTVFWLTVILYLIHFLFCMC